MKIVYISPDNTVREIIPPSATKPNVAHWYNEEFASRCVEAPDEVGQGWIYDPESKTFSPPEEPPKPSPAEQRKTAYETMAIIDWRGQTITVDAANQLWMQYEAEGNIGTAVDLQGLIKEAKAEIRGMFPDEP